MYTQFNNMSLQPQTVQANQPIAGQNLGSSMPKKYVTINGVMKINPEYKKALGQTDQPTSSALHPDQALTVISNMDDYLEANQANADAGSQERPLSESTKATIDMMQEPDMANQVGLAAHELVDELGAIFQKNEIPMGLMNKLMMLSEFDKLEFIIDDSGSMQCDSDTKNANNNLQTRWQEAQSRLQTMLEVLAFVPVQKIEVSFLNRPDVVQLQRSQNEAPTQFLQKSLAAVQNAFQKSPTGGTPVRQKLEASFNKSQGQSVARYLFCDGQPSGGQGDQQAITNMLIRRQNPAQNPITLLSCTNEDDQVAWMKEAEEVAPFCAEIDDFADEAKEVALDQGAAFPFTKGFHLICQLVGAMNPDDLDAMDESVPFTLPTMSNLLGVTTSEQEYQHYFDRFCEAQRNRPVTNQVDQVKRDAPFRAHYAAFLTTPLAKDLPVVQAFKGYVQQALQQASQEVAFHKPAHQTHYA